MIIPTINIPNTIIFFCCVFLSLGAIKSNKNLSEKQFFELKIQKLISNIKELKQASNRSNSTLKNCNESIIYIARDNGQIEEFNITTGNSSIATTSPYTPDNLNALAANPDAEIIYYGINKKVHYWDPSTNTHGTLVNLANQIGGQESLSSGGGGYYDGYVYMGTEDGNPGDHPKVYRIPVSADGMSTTGNAVDLNIPINSSASWGDMIITEENGNTIIYGGLGAGSGYSIYFRYTVDLDIYTMIKWNMPNELQLGVDVHGDLWGAALGGTTMQRIDRQTGNFYGNTVSIGTEIWDMTGPVNCPQLVEICGNGIDDDMDGLIDNADTECTTLPRKSTDCTKNIPSSGSSNHTITSTLTITEQGTIQDLNVATLDVQHSYINDLRIKLISPVGTEVLLMDRPCSSDNNIFITLDDESSLSSFSCPPTDGRNYQPESPLSAFDGENINGTWTLSVEDTYPSSDGGTVNCWALEFITAFTPSPEICDNGIDDDGDGDIDEADDDCVPPEICGNGIDDDMDGLIDNADDDCCAQMRLIPQNNFSLHYVDSEETVGENGAATNAFDGNTSTIWHSKWQGGVDAIPHEIQIDLGNTYKIGGFRYLPRQIGTNGRIANYEFYVSRNGANWGTAVAIGTFMYTDASEKEVNFPIQKCRYIRLVATSEATGQAFTSMSELNILECFGDEICDDGIDNDGDGLTDCNDPDCSNGLAVNIMATNNTICNGTNTTLTVSGSGGDGNYTYTWGQGLSNTASHTISPSTSTNYTVTVTDGNGCTATNQINITVNNCIEICDDGIDNDGDGLIDCNDPDCNNGLVVNITATSNTICNGTNTTLTVSGNGGDGNYTYTWDQGLSNAASHTLTPTTSTNYMVTVTDGNGCTATNQISITVNNCTEVCDDGMDNDGDGLIDCDDPDCRNGLIANITAIPIGDILCSPIDYEFIADDAGVGAIYTWNFGVNAMPNTATGRGPHTVRYTTPTNIMRVENEIVLDVQQNTCTANDTLMIEIRPSVTGATLDFAQISTCGGMDGAINLTVTGEQGACVKVSLDGGATYQPDGQLSFSNLGAGTYNIMLNYCDINCPSSFGTVTISEPSPIIANNDSIMNLCPSMSLIEGIAYNDINAVNGEYTILSNPEKGTLTMETNGVFEYQSVLLACGVDSFSYSVCDTITGCCSTASVIIQLEDTEAPDLYNIPAGLTINCDEQIPVSPLISVFDNCPAISLEEMEESTQGEDGCALYDYELTRRWTAMDICQNSTTERQVIKVQDITAPGIFQIYTLPNGKKMVAGVMEQVTHRWKTIQFPIDFATIPTVFTQVISSNDSSRAVARVQHSSLSQFEVRLQEEEANDDLHKGESVAWIAIEEGVNTTDFSMENTKMNIDNNKSTIHFTNTYDGLPAFFSSVQSNYDTEPIIVENQALSSNMVEVHLQEETSADMEVTHLGESIAYLAIDTATFIKSDKGKVIGEVTTIDISNGTALFTSGNSYYNPVIITNYLNNPNPNTVHVGVEILAVDSFEINLNAWDYDNTIYQNGRVAIMIIEGSLPLNVAEFCLIDTAILKPGIDIIAIDNCDNNVALNFEESIHFEGAKKVTTHRYSSTDECGNSTELVQVIECEGVALRTKAFLQGAAIASTDNLMRDDLRHKNLIPIEEPYTDMDNLEHFGEGGGEKLDTTLLGIENEKAVVDWVMLELRSADDPNAIIATKSALILRNGDIIQANGDSILVFNNVPENTYYVSIKHRNHLPMYSLNTYLFSTSNIPFVDFSDAFTPVMGRNHSIEIGDKRALWSGDLSGDNKTIFQGPNNDIFHMLISVLFDDRNVEGLTNFISRGYTVMDFNMDGQVIYQGPYNDRSALLYHVILNHPDNVSNISNFVVQTGVEEGKVDVALDKSN